MAPFKDYDELNSVASAHEIKAARTIIRIAKEKLDSVRDELELNPKRNPESLRDDPVYLLGFIAGLRHVLDLQEKARKFLERVKQ